MLVHHYNQQLRHDDTQTGENNEALSSDKCGKNIQVTFSTNQT
jgi:hypothetical protein